MRIAVIQDCGPGGGERHLVQLLNGAKSAGHDIALFGRDRGGIESFREKNIPCHETYFPPWRKFLKRWLGWFALQHSIRTVLQFQPDVVIAGDIWTIPYAVRAAQKINCPVWGFVQAAGRDTDDFQNYQLARCDRLIVPSNYMREVLQDAGFSSEHITVIRPGINLQRFQPGLDRAKIRKEFGIPDEAFVVGCVGTISKEKGQGFLVGLLTQLPKNSMRHYLFIGENRRPFFHELQEFLIREGFANRATFTGYRRDTPELLAACDAFALPSRHESFSLALAEAMAMGLPCVYSGVGGTVEVAGYKAATQNDLEKQAALRAPLERSYQWNEYLQRLEEDGDFRCTLSRNARAHAEQCLKLDESIQKFVQLLVK